MQLIVNGGSTIRGWIAGGIDMLNRFKFRVMPIQQIRKIRQRKRDMRDREEAFYKFLIEEKKKIKERNENERNDITRNY